MTFVRRASGCAASRPRGGDGARELRPTRPGRSITAVDQSRVPAGVRRGPRLRVEVSARRLLASAENGTARAAARDHRADDPEPDGAAIALAIDASRLDEGRAAAATRSAAATTFVGAKRPVDRVAHLHLRPGRGRGPAVHRRRRDARRRRCGIGRRLVASRARRCTTPSCQASDDLGHRSRRPARAGRPLRRRRQLVDGLAGRRGAGRARRRRGASTRSPCRPRSTKIGPLQQLASRTGGAALPGRRLEPDPVHLRPDRPRPAGDAAAFTYTSHGTTPTGRIRLGVSTAGAGHGDDDVQAHATPPVAGRDDGRRRSPVASCMRGPYGRIGIVAGRRAARAADRAAAVRVDARARGSRSGSRLHAPKRADDEPRRGSALERAEGAVRLDRPGLRAPVRTGSAWRLLHRAGRPRAAPGRAVLPAARRRG